MAKIPRHFSRWTARKLIEDLWWFIENVNDETPDRTDRFFALRERVREFYGPLSHASAKTKPKEVARG